MGFLSFLFPKPADRVAKARRFLNEERYAEARTEVMDVDLDEAREIRTAAEQKLAKANLERALHWGKAGNYEQVESHLELAHSLDDGSQPELFAEVAGILEKLAEEHRVTQVWSILSDASMERRRMGGDPGDFTFIAYEGQGAIRLFFFQGRQFGLPGLEFEPDGTWFHPTWLSSVSDSQVSNEDGIAAIQGQIETHYSAESLSSMGPERSTLAHALLHMANRRPEEAAILLMGIEDSGAVIQFELGRAAMALGQHEAAALAFENSMASGMDMGAGVLPPAVLMAVNYSWNDDPEAAYETLRAIESNDERVLQLKVALAVEAGILEDAQKLLEAVDPDDDSYLQLHGALKLQDTLRAQLELHPILTEAGSEENTEARSAAMEIVMGVLQAELDQVISAMQDLEEADEATRNDEGDLDSEQGDAEDSKLAESNSSSSL